MSSELKRALEALKPLDDTDLLKVIDVIHMRWLEQRDAANERAVDFESGIMNLVKTRKPTPETYADVLDRFVQPHLNELRSLGYIPKQLKKYSESHQSSNIRGEKA